MSTGIYTKFVEESYRRMPDDELIRIATQDAFGLTPEALEIVNAEIARRNLGNNIVEGVKAQNKTYTVEEIDAYCDIVSGLSYPVCGDSRQKLKGTMTGEVMSFLVFTTYEKKIKIGCPSCLFKANNNALTKSVLLGWWGIPWGIVRTIQAISLNQKSIQATNFPHHNNYFRQFTLSIIGELESYKDDRAKLQQVIARKN